MSSLLLVKRDHCTALWAVQHPCMRPDLRPCKEGASYRYVPFFALHLHSLLFICSKQNKQTFKVWQPHSMSAGSGLTSHIYACIRILCTGTKILYAAPCKLLEQCLFLAAPCTHRHVYLAQHAASPRLQVVITLAASPRPLVCRNRVCLLASHITVLLYGGRQNACGIISSNILVSSLQYL